MTYRSLTEELALISPNADDFHDAGARNIEERSGTNAASVYRYFYDTPGSDRLLSRIDATGNRIYYLQDARGYTTSVSDANGTVLEQYLYDAYGAPSVYDAAGNPRAGNQSATDNRYLFNSSAGYEWLPTANLYFARARFLQPNLGRWLSPDPSGFAGGDSNLFRYCGNDSVNGNDPSGLADSDDQTYVPKHSTGIGPLQIGPTPTGTNIPDVTYDSGPDQLTDSSITGMTVTGVSQTVLNSMKTGGYEGTDVQGNVYARATAVNGPTPPTPDVVIAIPGFGGGTYSPRMSNNDLRVGVGTDAFIIGRDQLANGVAYADNMQRLGSTTFSIYGYSLGGPAAIKLADMLNQDQFTVDSLNTIDPVMLFGGTMSVPDNVEAAQNYYQQNGGVSGLLPWNLGNFGGTIVNGANNYSPGERVDHPDMPSYVFHHFP